ncbi:MAG: DMT family transporter [Bacillota bacterium]
MRQRAKLASRPNETLMEVLMLSVVLIWGANYTIAKYGMRELSPTVFTFLRFLAVTPVLFGWLKLTEKQVSVKVEHLPRLVMVGFFGIACYQTLFVAAVKYTSAANSSLLVALSPLFTSLIAGLLGRERLTPRTLVGSLLAFSGVAVIMAGGTGRLGFSSQTAQGDLIALLAGFLWGLYPILAQPLLKHYSAVRVTAYAALFGAMALFLYTFPELGAVPWRSLAPATWLSVLYAIGPVTAWGLIVWNKGVERLGASRAIINMYLVPAVSMVIAAILIRERIYPVQLLGFVVIVGGIVIVKSGFALGTRQKGRGAPARKKVR